jgi:hypothetical protein
LKLQLASFALFVASICFSIVGVHWAQRIEGSEILYGTAHADAYEFFFSDLPGFAGILSFLFIVIGGLLMRKTRPPVWTASVLILMSLSLYFITVCWSLWVDKAFP